jgi:hypothetical protein
MSAIQYEPRDDQGEDEDEEEALAGPQRPQRRRLGRSGALLLTLLVGAIGFYVGVRVEKGQIGSSSTASSGISAPSGGFSGRSSGSTLSKLPGASGASGGASFGTVAALNGRTIYVKESSGNTVKVKIVSATKITKSLGVSRKAIRPGDSVVVQGASGTSGSLTATSISDTGASSSSTSSTTSTGSTGSSSGSSSLFGSSAGG